MCYYVEYIEKLESYFYNQYGEVIDWHAMDVSFLDNLPDFYFIGGFEHPKMPLVYHNGIEMMEWGLIPYWVKDAAQAADIRLKTLNAVSETAWEKPSFRESIKKRRGLLTVTAFFEWRQHQGKKYPYRIAVRHKKLFSLGCIFDQWVDKTTGEIKKTFSILTTQANELMAEIHNSKKRMPLIIAEPDFKAWLNPATPREEVTALMKPCNTNELTAYSIAQFANNSRNYRNVPEISEPVVYPELENPAI